MLNAILTWLALLSVLVGAVFVLFHALRARRIGRISLELDDIRLGEDGVFCLSPGQTVHGRVTLISPREASVSDVVVMLTCRDTRRSGNEAVRCRFQAIACRAAELDPGKAASFDFALPIPFEDPAHMLSVSIGGGRALPGLRDAYRPPSLIDPARHFDWTFEASADVDGIEIATSERVMLIDRYAAQAAE